MDNFHAFVAQTLHTTFEEDAIATGRERLMLTAAVSGYKTQMETSYEPHLIHKYVGLLLSSSISSHAPP